MSILIMATAFASGRVGFCTHARRAQQPKFFAGKVHEQDAPLQLSPLRSEQARQFENARCSAGVIVRPGMNLPDLRRREGIEIAPAEMIVVRPDDHVFIALAGQPRENIVDRCACGLDVDMERQMERVGESEQTRVSWLS